MAAVLCQKFGRLLLNAGAGNCFRSCNDNIKVSTTTAGAALFHTSPPAAVDIVPVRLPQGFNPPTAFGLFVKEQMLGQAGSPVSVKMKNVSNIWKNLSEDEKQHYVGNAKRIGDEKRDNFEKMSDEQKQEVIEAQTKKTAKLRRVRRKKLLHELYANTNRPKGPLASYMLFAKERFTQHKPGKEELLMFAKETGELWRQMSEQAKQPYVDQARTNLVTYRQQLAEWEQKHHSEIQHWHETNEPKKKKTAKKAAGGAHKKATTKAELKKKQKKRNDEMEGGAHTEAENAVKKGRPKKEVAEGLAEEEKKVKASAVKKVKKADVKGAID